MIEEGRLIIDSPADGSWNMAVDQALLETADTTGLVTLRFYQWSQPTLSLGYFQSHRDRSLHPESLDCQMVRRKTGGGAILHDNELTYSLCVPSANRWSQKNSDLYEMVHEEIIAILDQDQIVANLYRDQHKHEGSLGKTIPAPVVDQKSFMCFERRSGGDICLQGFKIVGSAQRRLKNSLLQHGSILINGSAKAKSLPGIKDLVNFGGDAEQIATELGKRLANRLRISLKNGKLSNKESGTASQIESGLFRKDEWNLRR